MADDTFYVTTPIYYVNDKPHIGHAFTTILADTLKRFHQLCGRETHFLTGTDEHGQKVERAAADRGVCPQEHCDSMVGFFEQLATDVGASHDDFIRTTEERHTKVVTHLLQSLFDKGEIYKSEYDGWYCVADEAYYTDKDVVDGMSPSGRPVERITETNYFFKMGAYQDWLIKYIEDNPTFIQPDFRRNETLGFLRSQTLNDLCISRPKSRLSWGIPLPFDEEFVTFVWFDALTNYISAIGYPENTETFGKWWPALHLIGKDILTTHTVYWPTMLQAAGIPQPETIFAHGWWLNDNRKMGKSDGNVIKPAPYLEAYGIDAFRYGLLAEMVMGQDSSFSDRTFNLRYNAELANDLGNLGSRVTKLLAKNLDGKAPDVAATALDGAPEKELWALAQDVVASYEADFKAFATHKAIAQVMRLVRAVNGYLEVRAPWKQAKEDDLGPFGITIYTSLECLRIASILLQPVMPNKMAELRTALGLSGDPRLNQATQWGLIPAGASITPVALFPRKILAEEPEDKPAATPKKNVKKTEGVTTTDQISIDDFTKVKLRTAKVINAEKVEGKNKLLKLEVMVGSERRQIVAGIADFYDPDTLRHKVVIVVANLKPAIIAGIESQGMLLAASMGSNLKLLTVDGEMASGSKVQ